MNTTLKDIGWGFWLRWVLASFLGSAAGVVIGGSAGSAIGEGFAGMGTVGVIFGALLGTMQWLVMRKYVALTGWWALATAFGYFLAGISTEQWVFRQVPYSQVAVPAIVSFGAVGGIVGGIMQWLILRQHVARSGWWVVVSIVGLALGIGGPVALTLGQTDRGVESAIMFAVLFAVGVGAIPGAMLVWLLGQDRAHNT